MNPRLYALAALLTFAVVVAAMAVGTAALLTGAHVAGIPAYYGIGGW